jgi:hypothetical protein
MSKIAALQNTLNRTAKPTPPAPVRPAEVETERSASVSSRPPSREGKTHIGAYLSPGFKSSLMLVRAQTGEDAQTLIARALNDLFRAHNVPVIDHN